jgi:hypothetical protein
MDEKQDFAREMFRVRTRPFITPKARRNRMAEIKKAAAKQRGQMP